MNELIFFKIPPQDAGLFIGNLHNSVTDEEFTALHFATYHGNGPLIKFLIENCEADMHKKNKYGSTVLHIAA